MYKEKETEIFSKNRRAFMSDNTSDTSFVQWDVALTEVNFGDEDTHTELVAGFKLSPRHTSSGPFTVSSAYDYFCGSQDLFLDEEISRVEEIISNLAEYIEALQEAYSLGLSLKDKEDK